jgi:hypothetical protein
MELLLTTLVRILGAQLVDRLVAATITALTNWAVSRQLDEIKVKNLELDQERYYLLREIHNAKTNEDRRILSGVLARLHSGDVAPSEPDELQKPERKRKSRLRR